MVFTSFMHEPTQRAESAVGRRRSLPTRTEIAVLDAVSTRGHVAPCTASGVRAVVEGPAAFAVVACLETRPGAIELRVTDDQEESPVPDRSLVRLCLYLDQPGPTDTRPKPRRPGARVQGVKRRRVRCGPTAVADEKRPDALARGSSGGQVLFIESAAWRNEPSSGEPLPGGSEVGEKVGLRVSLPGIYERLHEQKRHRRRLRLLFGHPRRLGHEGTLSDRDH